MKDEHGIAVVPGGVIAGILGRDRRAVTRVVGAAYEEHSRGASENPDSVFLHLAEQKARIIALPAYLAADGGKAGLKWIASFPANAARNRQRASAVIVLNSLEDGRPIALLEGSLISAHRTAALAAIAARVLHRGGTGGHRFEKIAVIGAGIIAREVLRYLAADDAVAREIAIFDHDPSSAAALRGALAEPQFASVVVADSLADALGESELVILATTAAAPHILNVALFAHGPAVLNISLRDLGIDVIVSSENYCDDVDHCLKARTSPHLAELATGGRAFVNGTLHDVMAGAIRPDPARTRIFSPFGLGVLDIALAHYCLELAEAENAAGYIADFFPDDRRF